MTSTTDVDWERKRSAVRQDGAQETLLHLWQRLGINNFTQRQWRSTWLVRPSCSACCLLLCRLVAVLVLLFCFNGAIHHVPNSIELQLRRGRAPHGHPWRTGKERMVSMIKGNRPVRPNSPELCKGWAKPNMVCSAQAERISRWYLPSLYFQSHVSTWFNSRMKLVPKRVYVRLKTTWYKRNIRKTKL